MENQARQWEGDDGPSCRTHLLDPVSRYGAPMPYAHHGDIAIYYEVMGGRPTDPPMLLINGLGSQCINFAEPWCAMLVDRGLQVIRFDNRDMGRSTHLGDRLPHPDGTWYSIDDMVGDALAVLDAVGAAQAHIVGLSMGGMIAQLLALTAPDRVTTLCSVMSSSGEPDHTYRSPEAAAQFGAPAPHDLETHCEAWAAGLRVWGSPAFADEARWRREAERSYQRSFDPTGSTRQAMAVAAAPPRADELRSLAVPTLVVHGDADTLIGPDAGRRTAALIPGARFELVEGMGHDYPPQLWERLSTLFADHALGKGGAAPG